MPLLPLVVISTNTSSFLSAVDEETQLMKALKSKEGFSEVYVVCMSHRVLCSALFVCCVASVPISNSLLGYGNESHWSTEACRKTQSSLLFCQGCSLVLKVGMCCMCVNTYCIYRIYCTYVRMYIGPCCVCELYAACFEASSNVC